jgi:hypothetical protein
VQVAVSLPSEVGSVSGQIVSEKRRHTCDSNGDFEPESEAPSSDDKQSKASRRGIEISERDPLAGYHFVNLDLLRDLNFNHRDQILR